MYLMKSPYPASAAGCGLFEKKGVVSMGTFITLVVVVGLVGLAVRSMIKDKKAAKEAVVVTAGSARDIATDRTGIIIRR